MSLSSLTASVSPLRAVLAEGAAAEPAVPPLLIGVGTLLLLLVLLGGLLMFGRGREHS